MISNAVTSGVHEAIPQDVLVLPCQYLGFSHHHIKFPGTLTSTTDTFMAIMEETIDSLAVRRPRGGRSAVMLRRHRLLSAGISHRH
jgi:creatinine amidohydrolase/Fe(II)-dependent formamide hydrolase-like protein